MEMTIGEKITFFRKRKGLSQEEVAEMIGISPQGYGKIERDETDVQYSRLESIAKAMNTTVNDISAYPITRSFNGNNNNINELNNSTYQSYQYYSDLVLQKEVEKLTLQVEGLGNEKALLQSKIKDLEEIIALLKERKS
jgi:transcriptional regulator with XRE-family HTH domain